MIRKLTGQTIVVTREPEQAGPFIKEIERNGGKSILFPTIRIVPPSTWNDFDNGIAMLRADDWIVFTSANAVRFAVPRINEVKMTLDNIQIAAIGPKTSEALKMYNLKTDLEARQYSANGLIEIFENRIKPGVNVFLPSSNLAGDELAEGLKSLDASVIKAEAYRTLPNTSVDAKWMADQLDKHAIDCLSFFSPSAFRFFMELIGGNAGGRIKGSGAAIAAIGTTTAEAIREKGLPVPICPKKSTAEHLIEAIVDYFLSDRGQELKQ